MKSSVVGVFGFMLYKWVTILMFKIHGNCKQNFYIYDVNSSVFDKDTHEFRYHFPILTRIHHLSIDIEICIIYKRSNYIV